MSQDSCQCQACGHPGVEMFDICTVCRWENDFSLEDTNEVYHEVGFVLTAVQRQWWSSANGDTAHWHSTHGHRNDFPSDNGDEATLNEIAKGWT